MKDLIEFSIKRRFKNKVTIILHILVTAILFCFVFSDKIIDLLFVESHKPTKIYYDESVQTYENHLKDESDMYVFKRGVNKDHINIKKTDKWIVESQFDLNPIEANYIRMLIEDAVVSKWLSEMSEDSIVTVLDKMYPKIEEVSLSKVGVSVDKQNVSMFIITGIYFAMLSFSTMIANEVVYEKTSKVLELILTSVSTTTHYLSKMIIGWLTIIIQLATIILELIMVFVTRNYYDKGSGLLKMLKKYQLIHVEANTFRDFLIALDITKNLVLILLISLIYLLLGVIIIQTIMVCLSSFIKSIEESSAIQAPVYIVLLIIYYLALAFNSPARLSEGLGYYFSMTPIFSMLFMPMRLLLINVSTYEILLGIVLNIMFLLITTYYGAYIYNIGILGGLNFRIFNQRKNKP